MNDQAPLDRDTLWREVLEAVDELGQAFSYRTLTDRQLELITLRTYTRVEDGKLRMDLDENRAIELGYLEHVCPSYHGDDCEITSLPCRHSGDECDCANDKEVS